MVLQFFEHIITTNEERKIEAVAATVTDGDRDRDADAERDEEPSEHEMIW